MFLLAGERREEHYVPEQNVPFGVVLKELIAHLKSTVPNYDAHVQKKILRLLQWLDEFDANKAWMLDMLSTLTDRKHKFFAPGYVAPKKTIGEPQVNNINGFFDDLGIADRPADKTKAPALFETFKVLEVACVCE